MGSNDAKIIFARGGLGGLTAAGCLLLAAFDVEVSEQAPSSLRSSRAFSRAPMRPMSCTILAFETHCGTSPICRPSGSFDYLTTVRCCKLCHWPKITRLATGPPYLQMHRADLQRILL